MGRGAAVIAALLALGAGDAAGELIPTYADGYAYGEVFSQNLVRYGTLRALTKASGCSGVETGVALIYEGGGVVHTIELKYQMESQIFTMTVKEVGGTNPDPSSIFLGWAPVNLAPGAEIMLQVVWGSGGVSFQANGVPIRSGGTPVVYPYTRRGTGIRAYESSHRIYLFSRPAKKSPSAACFPIKSQFGDVSYAHSATADSGNDFLQALWSDDLFANPPSARPGWVRSTAGSRASSSHQFSTLLPQAAVVVSSSLEMQIGFLRLQAIASDNPDLTNTIADEWRVRAIPEATIDAWQSVESGGFIKLAIQNTGNEIESISVTHKTSLGAADRNTVHCAIGRILSSKERNVSMQVSRPAPADRLHEIGDEIFKTEPALLPKDEWRTYNACFVDPPVTDLEMDTLVGERKARIEFDNYEMFIDFMYMVTASVSQAPTLFPSPANLKLKPLSTFSSFPWLDQPLSRSAAVVPWTSSLNSLNAIVSRARSVSSPYSLSHGQIIVQPGASYRIRLRMSATTSSPIALVVRLTTDSPTSSVPIGGVSQFVPETTEKVFEYVTEPRVQANVIAVLLISSRDETPGTTNDVLTLADISLEELETPVVAPDLEITPPLADRSTEFPTLADDSFVALNLSRLRTLAPTIDTKKTPAPLHNLTVAYDGRYMNLVVKIGIPSYRYVPETLNITLLREALAGVLQTVEVPVATTFNAQNIKILKVCLTVPQNLAVLNSSDLLPPPRLEPEGCRAVDGLDPNWFAHLNSSFRGDIHLMIVNLPDQLSSIRGEVTRNFVKTLDQVIIDTNGAIGPGVDLTGDAIAEWYNAESPLATPVPTPVPPPGDPRSEIDTYIWVLVLVGLAVLCCLGGIALAHHAANARLARDDQSTVYYSDDEMESYFDEGNQQESGESIVDPGDVRIAS